MCRWVNKHVIIHNRLPVLQYYHWFSTLFLPLRMQFLANITLIKMLPMVNISAPAHEPHRDSLLGAHHLLPCQTWMSVLVLHWFTAFCQVLGYSYKSHTFLSYSLIMPITYVQKFAWKCQLYFVARGQGYMGGYGPLCGSGAVSLGGICLGLSGLTQPITHHTYMSTPASRGTCLQTAQLTLQ